MLGTRTWREHAEGGRFQAMSGFHLWSRVVISVVGDFDLARTLTCGQAFGWTRARGGFGVYSGEINEMPVTCFSRSSGDKDPRPDSGTNFNCRVPTESREKAICSVKDYFDLDRDYAALVNELITVDPKLRAVLTPCRGLRLLRQEPWETLISFIISACNNIPRIRRSVLGLKHCFGRPLAGKMRTFPGAHVLSQVLPEDLTRLGLGFRVRYVKEAADMVASERVNLELLKGVPTGEARKVLMAIPGVGQKIADCVLLYAYSRTEVFPVDVWVKRVVEQVYCGGRERSIKYIIDFATDRWGPHAGFVQLYLYDYIRRIR